jgi:hypothetical protein
MKFAFLRFVVLAGTCSLSIAGAGQAQNNGGTKGPDEATLKQNQQPGRVGVLPQFGVSNQMDAPPLTPGGKFNVFARTAFDPATFGIVGIEAALRQAENHSPGYGQGMQGYGKRYGASFADTVSTGFWSNFFYPTLFKEDPRYFRLGEGGFGHRFVYGVKQEFVCHTDKGGRSFSFNNVLGALTSGAISNLYYPGKTLIRTVPATETTPARPVYENDRGVGPTMSRAAFSLAYGTAAGIVDEFWPDVHDKIFKRKKSGAASLNGNR